MKIEFTPQELTILDESPLSAAYAETFVYAPSNKDEDNLGCLYVVIEASSNKSKKENAAMVASLAAAVKDEYYNNTIVTPLSALRFSLKKANRLIASQKAWLATETALKLKAVVASLKDAKVHIARMGEAAALILRDGRLQHITAPPRAKQGIYGTNHVRDLLTSNGANKSAWVFENIISGEILPQDRLIFATNQIYKINEGEIATGLKADQLIQRIKNRSDGIKNLALIALSQKNTLSGEIETLRSAAPPQPTGLEENGRRARKKEMWRKLKPLAAAAVLVAAAATVAGLALKIKNETAQNKKEAGMIVQELNGLKEKAAALAQVKNETEAGELLGQAQQKLRRLEELKYFRTTRVSLAEEFNRFSQSLLRLENIDGVRAVLDLENNSADFDPLGLALGKNKIVLFDRSAVYNFDLNRREGNFSSLKDGGIVAALEKPNDPDTLWVITQDKIALWSALAEPKTIWSRGENQPPFKEAALYNEAFYLLGENGLIYKLPFIVSSTTSDIVTQELTLWSNDDISDFGLRLPAKATAQAGISDFTVEGSIFALADEHTMVEVANSQKRNQTTVREPLAKIFTSPVHTNIYALSPAEGLVVVLDKSLYVKKRLSHPELRGAKAVAVNSQERMVYFLKGKTVYSFEI